MAHIHGFAPIADAHATTLILGSMPGKASLQAQQYYGHPQNAFWRIMQTLLGFEPDRNYADRCNQLIAHRIAVWDVLKTCTRSSSLDSDIVESSIVTNDFAAFFEAHPKISAIYFNGAKAESVYRKQVRPNLPEKFAELTTTRLPSTSPANASISFPGKLEKWIQIRSEE